MVASTGLDHAGMFFLIGETSASLTLQVVVMESQAGVNIESRNCFEVCFLRNLNQPTVILSHSRLLNLLGGRFLQDVPQIPPQLRWKLLLAGAINRVGLLKAWPILSFTLSIVGAQLLWKPTRASTTSVSKMVGVGARGV